MKLVILSIAMVGTLLANQVQALDAKASDGEELLSTLSMLKDAVIAGELDDAITNASDNLRAGFSK